MAALIRSQPDLDLVGESADGASAFQMALAEKPDVILLDIQLPGLHGPEVTKLLLAEVKEPRIIGLTMLPPEDPEFRAMKAAGAFAVCQKDADPHVLLDTIRAAMAGQKRDPGHAR
jgi:DNA-binding NarL/FixJ family response regulator